MIKMWNLQTKNEGSEILMKDYQKVIINTLIDSDYFLTTGEMHELVKKELGPKENGQDAISRASVIFFMKDLHEWGYSQMEKGTGKGGIHSKYNITTSRDQTMEIITEHITQSLSKALTKTFN